MSCVTNYMGLLVAYTIQLLVDFSSLAYPAYNSIKAIENRSTEEQQKLLLYWIVLANIVLIDRVFGFIVVIIPFYWHLKIGLMIWCIVPIQNNGTVVLYRCFVRPVFIKYHELIDKYINSNTRGYSLCAANFILGEKAAKLEEDIKSEKKNSDHAIKSEEAKEEPKTKEEAPKAAEEPTAAEKPGAPEEPKESEESEPEDLEQINLDEDIYNEEVSEEGEEDK